MMIDLAMPSYDVRSRHWRALQAEPNDAYNAVWEMDLSRSVPAVVMFGIRGLPHLLTGRTGIPRRFGLAQIMELGFVILAEDPPNGVVLGVAGRFWRPTSAMLQLTADEFRAFDEPGYAKGVMSFELSGTHVSTLLSTETRVQCTDERARRAFMRYWTLIGPFSGWIRHIMMNDIKRRAEAFS